MSGPVFMGQIRIMAFRRPPRGWASCNGQSLPIEGNEALFSLIGSIYGGDGDKTFALPDLRSRTPIGFSDDIIQGHRYGEEAHTLTTSQIPRHSHSLSASDENANDVWPKDNLLSKNTAGKPYTKFENLASMADNTIENAGGSGAHNNMQPYLTLNYCIALTGSKPANIESE